MLPDRTFGDLDDLGTFTDQWYALLPGFMRHLDTSHDQQLFRYLQLLGDQGEEVMQLAVDADSGRLTDPYLTPDALMPWLAQMVGVTVAGPVRSEALRSRISDLQAVARPGSAPAIAAVVRTLLTDTKQVSIVSHYGGDPWVIAVIVRTAEAPVELGDVTAAVVDAGQKPAGWTLVTVGVSADWGAWDDLGATWADADTAGGATWHSEEQATWS